MTNCIKEIYLVLQSMIESGYIIRSITVATGTDSSICEITTSLGYCSYLRKIVYNSIGEKISDESETVS